MCVIWNPEREQLDRTTLREIQLERLRQTVALVYEKVPYYRNLFDDHGVKPSDLQDLSDIRKFPMTTKDALRQNYPFGLFAAPREEMVRLHASSGTTGKPIVAGYTRRDLDTWSELIARIVTMAGVKKGDVAQVAFGYGLFTGGFGLHYGLEKVGATVVPASIGNTQRQLMLMEDFGTTALICTPSYALHMAEEARELGKDPASLPLRVGLFGAEPWSEGMRREIEAVWGITATDNYGLTELMGPGVAGECRKGEGLHIAEDHFFWEVIDPETGEPVPEGQPGELVFTTLTKEGFPVIRYRTRDISCVTTEPCPCGRTSARMMRVTGRTDDMLIIRGVNVFPSQIEAVLMAMEGVSPNYLLVVDRKEHLDTLEVQVELEESQFTDNYGKLEAIALEIRDQLRSVLQLSCKVRLVEPKSIERSQGKAKRILDLRQK